VTVAPGDGATSIALTATAAATGSARRAQRNRVLPDLTPCPKADRGALRPVDPRTDARRGHLGRHPAATKQQLAEAEKLYGAIFETAPDNPDALHYAGVLAHQLGRSDEGVALIEKSLALVPNRADCYSNLGIIYQAQGKLREAIAAYRAPFRSIPITRMRTAIWACCCGRRASRSKPRAAYRDRHPPRPTHIDAYTNLGILLTA
jgi:Flp pilus assembly protein TadD